MTGNDAKQIPRLGSLDELVRFFDSHDMGEYWDQMPEAQFEVHLTGEAQPIQLERDVAQQLERIARARSTTSQALVNAWLREKCTEYA